LIPVGVASLAWCVLLAWFNHEVRSALRLLAPIATKVQRHPHAPR
jgi:hypothetical protein